MSLKLQLQPILNSLMHVGVDKLADADLEKHVIQTNLNGLLYFVLDLSLALIFTLFGADYVAGLLCLSGGMFLIGSIGLNQFGLYNLSRISTVSIGSILVVACTFYLGKPYLAHASLLLGAIFPFVYFRTKEVFQISICLSVPVLCYIALIYFNYDLGPRMPDKGQAHQIILEAIFMFVPFVGIVGNTFTAVSNREKALQKVQESKDQISALFQVLSHDFSSPLMVAQMVARSGLEKGRVEPAALQGLNRSVDNLVRMLIKFKKLSNVLAGKSDFELEAVDIREVIERVKRNLEDTLRKKQITLEFIDSTKDGAPLAWGDAVVLECQIFQNLIHNALKFSVAGQKITVRAETHDHDWLKVYVIDQGIGIEPSKLKRIFSWTDPTTTMGTAGEVGTGFGLPTVKICVEALHGTVEVASRRKANPTAVSGTTFTLKFKHGQGMVQRKPSQQRPRSAA